MPRSPVAKPAPVSRATFLTAVAESAAGPSRQTLAQLAADVSPTAPAAVLAHHLVVRGVLTRFQADQLLAGNGDCLILGPYLLLEPTGEEDDGRLYRARHLVMDRLVGVWIADQPGRSARLEAARLVARLTHPHVLTVLDVHPDAERPYVVTEYVDGTSLETLVQVAGRLPVGVACDLLRQIALGLAHTHAQGMGHGRLTASSVRVGRPGGTGVDGPMTAKLTGFVGDPADADTICNDLLALGRLAVHLLAGRPDSPLPASVPQEVVLVVAELTHANPYRRLSATLVAERLAPFAGSRSTATESMQEVCPFRGLRVDPVIRPVPRATPIGERRRWALAGLATVGLLVVAVAATRR